MNMHQSRTMDRLVVALSLALEEIHHPGSARTSGFDITALCNGVLSEAEGVASVAALRRMIATELQARAA